MTPQEFAERSVGLPWRRWRSDWAAMDCYGLCVLYHRCVLGVDLGAVPQAEIADGFAAEAARWQQCEPEPGATAFMAWSNGAPTHCGMLIPGGMLLHAQEGRPVPEHGSVRLTRLAAMRRGVPDLRFYRYAGTAGTAGAA